MLTVFGWRVLVAAADFLCEKSTAGWLVLVLCEREILLAGCSEDEANRVSFLAFRISMNDNSCMLPLVKRGLFCGNTLDSEVI